MTEVVEELGLIATQAERSSVFTDEAQWMRTDGVADALYRAIDRIEQLEAALREICDGSRDADKSYAELFAEVCIEARNALAGEKKDD